MARVSLPGWFRAEGAVVPWHEIDRRQLENVDPPREVIEQRKHDLADRAIEVHLRWSCRSTIGVPLQPFEVWIRPMRDELRPVDVEIDVDEDDLRLSLPAEAAAVEIDCAVADASRAVAAFGVRGHGALRATVAAEAVRGAAGSRVRLRLRGSGMTQILLVNGSDPRVSLQALRDVIDAPDWELFERVGLPVDGSWSSTGYDHDDQGLVTAPAPPPDAALERLLRGRPPTGWAPFTETGAVAPFWKPVDPGAMVDEVHRQLLPVVEPCFEPGILSIEQHKVRDERHVDPPQQNGRRSSATTKAALAPIELLLLAGGSESAVALASGFGTAYAAEPKPTEGIMFGESDFLVTAAYEGLPFIGTAELASFVPWPGEHTLLAAPAAITAERDGLVRPTAPDDPWHETVKVSWARVESTAALGRPSGVGAARYDSSTLPGTESLIPPRDAGGWRTLLPVPDGVDDEPGADRNAIVDAEAPLPIGGSHRTVGFGVAVHDVFGIWSDWSDVTHGDREPPPPVPRFISARLDAAYTGSTTCPTNVEIELALDWSTRTPITLELALGYFPMATAETPPPGGLGPQGPTPSGTFRSLVTIPFLGPAPTEPIGVEVVALDTAGENIVTPGPQQGTDGRRYRLRTTVPTLAFANTGRWGMRVWARSALAGLGAGPWSPVETSTNPPIVAVAASPVPIAPLPISPPPGVPLGSIPDAEGHSHVKVAWSLPGGSNPENVIVWEVAEAAFRQKRSLPAAAEGTLPGVRLAQLRAGYDAMPSDRRRSLFRRILELPGTAREADVTLPKGSRDIHLFAVTTTSSTGVESDWPSTTAETSLQVAIAPRVVRPAAPALRSTIGAAGLVAISLESKSLVDVREFRLYRTRSLAAARRFGSMGPPFATVAAVPPAAGATPDPITGEATWTASWSGSFAESWDDWFVRAVAVPVDEMPVEAVRGRLSEPCEPVVISVRPTGPPDLAPLTHRTWGAANNGVVVETSTSAPLETTPIGDHRLRLDADGVELVIPALDDITEDTDEPPSGAAASPVVVRGARTAGRTPLSVWFVRPDRAQQATVAFRLIDPKGRVAEQQTLVPPWQPPQLTLDILEASAIAGRGVALTLRSNAPVGEDDPGDMTISATPRSSFGGIGFGRPISASFILHNIPVRRRPAFGRFTDIDVVRTSTASPFDYAAFLRVGPPVTMVVSITLADGRTATARRHLGFIFNPFDPPIIRPFEPPPFDPDPFRPPDP